MTPKRTNIISQLDKDQLDTLHYIYDYYSKLGMSHQDIAGIAANIFKESSFRHNSKDSSGYHGYVQMSPDMQQAVINAYGNLNPDTQLQFVYDQITGNSKIKGYTNGAGYQYGKYKTGGDAAEAFRHTFERNKAGRQQSRIDYGNQFYDYFNQRSLKQKVGQQPKPIVLQPVSTAVRQPIPAEQTRYTWTGAENEPSYVTGKPIVKLQPRVQLPSLVEMVEDSEWEPPFPQLKPMYKDGKLPHFKDGTRYLWDDQKGGWDRITDSDVANAMAQWVFTPTTTRTKFDYENTPNPIRPLHKNAEVKPDNTLWTRQQVEKANNTRTWRSDAADIAHAVGEAALLAANFVPFEGEVAQGFNWAVNNAKSYITHPFYKTVYHGSDYPFDIKNAWTATYHDLGLHVGPKETAKEMAGRGGTIYRLRIPKENTETIDIGSNGSRQLYDNYFMPARSRQFPNDFYDTTPGDDLRISMLKEAGAEPYVEGNKLYTENTVMLPLRKTAYPNIPEKYMRNVHEICRQTLMNEDPLSIRKLHDSVLQKKLNQQANDILSNSGYKVIKYHNANPYEGGGTAYMITDPSVMDVMLDMPKLSPLVWPTANIGAYLYNR